MIDSKKIYDALTNHDNYSWSMVDITVENHESEIVSDALWSLGVVAIEEITCDESRMTLRTSLGQDPTLQTEQLRTIFPNATITQTQIPRGVADTWRQFAEPTWVTSEVVIVPAWQTMTIDKTCIFIEPGDTFGLGNHPTTVLAMQLIFSNVPSGSYALDFGCGSGVLAIGASILLRCSVEVFDISLSSQNVVAHNCEINRVTDVVWSTTFAQKTFDAIFANILAPVLRDEAGLLVSCTKSQGLIVLSGMRTEQAPDVLTHYPNCVEVARQSLEGWTAVVLQKND